MLIKRMIVIFIVGITLLFVFPHATLAAKKRVRKAAAPRAVGVTYSTAKLNRASRSAVVTFINQTNVAKVDYELEYTANGIPQGVIGSISSQGSTTFRDLYFGTCSKGVCTPHYGITNATLIVTTTLKSGATNTKRYRFKSI